MHVNNNAPIDMLATQRPEHAMNADARKQAAMAKLAAKDTASGTVSLRHVTPLGAKALTSAAEPPPSPHAGVAQREADPLTVKGLMEEWGEKGSVYDLDGDGTVGMSDLIELLSRLAPAAEPVPATPPAERDSDLGISATRMPSLDDEALVAPEEPPIAPPDPMTVDELMEAWGERGSRYDLDGNGTVGMQDLIALLSRLASAENDGASADDVAATGNTRNEVPDQGALDDSVAAPPLPPSDPTEPLTVQGLVEAWGERGSRYDLSGDGVVNMQDLVALLSRLGGEDGSRGGPSHRIRAAAAALVSGPSHSDQEASSTRRIADALRERLDRGGFKDNPPTNIHRLVAGLKLSPSREQSLLDHLSKQYPEGLGVNVTA